jgi:cell volume regulation protein A
MTEPTRIALALSVLGILLGICALFSRAAGRVGVPLALAFLVIGLLAGSEGVGGIPFEDYGLTFRLGTAALAVILFDGGLHSSWPALRRVLSPAAVLATAGVVLTAAVLAGGARLLGLAWGPALLLGAVASSTDAAAVFAVLRGGGVRLRKRVAALIEAESGLNDPMAVLLTAAVAAWMAGRGEGALAVAGDVVLQLVVGAGLGAAIGLLARSVLVRFPLPAAGLYPALTLAFAFVAYGVPSLLGGSGFLAVYVAGIVLGNGELPYRHGILHVFDSAAWFCQVALFLLLGLLAFPSRLAAVAGTGMALAAILALVARPVAVFLCLLPFRLPLAEISFTAWVGLRGAVPVVLAAYPVLEKVPGADGVFDLVFFVVAASALVPGATVRRAAVLLDMESPTPPPPAPVLEVSSLRRLRGDVLSYTVTPALPAANRALRDLPLPPSTAVLVVVRGEELVAPRGGLVLEPGDHVHLLLGPGDRGAVTDLFGHPED